MSGEYRLEKGERKGERGRGREREGGRERERERAREIEKERENIMYLKTTHINVGAGNFSLPYTHISDTLGFG